MRSDSLSAGELLRRGVERIERLKEQPLVLLVGAGVRAPVRPFKLEAGGKLKEAGSLEREAAAIWERTLGPLHSNRQAVLMDIGQNVARQGRLAESDSLFNFVLNTIRDVKGDSTTAGFGLTLARPGALRIQQGRHAEADSLIRLGRSILLRHTTEEHRDVRGVTAMLAKLHADMGRTAGAEYWRQRAKGARPLCDLSPPKR